MHLSNSYAQEYSQENNNTLMSQIYPQSQVQERKLKESISTHRETVHNCNSDNLTIARLESKTLQLQKKLDTQNYQIDTLSAETEHYMKVCDEQKEQLDMLDVEMVREEYNEQIRELGEEREKLAQLIFNLTQEYKEVEAEYESRLNAKKARNAQLTLLVEEALSAKEKMLGQIGRVDREIQENQCLIDEQEERIDELRNVERKLFLALREKKELQDRKN